MKFKLFAMMHCALLCAVAGCSEGGSSYSSKSSQPVTDAGQPAVLPDRADQVDALVLAQAAEAPAGQAPAAQAEEAQAAVGNDQRAAIQRQIVYRADLKLSVDDFQSAAGQVTDLVNRFGGYVAESKVQRNSHSGQWTIRVPERRFSEFLTSARGLGKVHAMNIKSEDVTAEFYDVQVRISNKQREEQRLLKHLENSTGKLEEILAVEREISRVRQEVERLQGRSRVLQDLTALTTVTLTIAEHSSFLPRLADMATFGNRIAEGFEWTIHAMLLAGQLLIILFVVIGPWVVLLTLIAGPALAIRNWIQRRRRTPTSMPAT